jgi:5,10-methylenetetrahydromethanopterin reductase
MQTATIAFQTDKPLSHYGPLAAQVEAYGYDGVTVYNDMLYQPAWLPLLEMARATQRIRVGVAAVNPFTSHPINIAGNIALIDEATDGRAYLGLARGGWLDFVGVEPQRPVTALREAMACVRHLLRQSTEPLDGEIFPLAGGDSLRWSILRPDISFLLGSWGVKTIRACIAQIDEIKIGGSANPDVLPHFRNLVSRAVAEAGVNGDKIDGDAIGLVIGAVTVVDEDGADARRLARREVALYLPIVATLDPTVSVEPELKARIQSAADQYDFETAGALISDDLLARFALAGTPDEVAEQANALYWAGAQRVEFGTPHGLSTAEGLRLLGQRVLPALIRA